MMEACPVTAQCVVLWSVAIRGLQLPSASNVAEPFLREATMPLMRLSRSVVSGAAVLLCSIAFAACGEGTGPDEPPTPTFTGRWGEEPWNGRASAILVSGGAADDSLYVGAVFPVDAPVGMPGQTILVATAGTGPGTYVLEGPSSVRVTYLLGGDGVVSAYGGSGPATGILEITEFGGPGGIVEGRVEFEAITSYGYQPVGPTARFEEGWFRATIEPRSRVVQ